jgi:hypothetical protein
VFAELPVKLHANLQADFLGPIEAEYPHGFFGSVQTDDEHAKPLSDFVTLFL